VTARHASVGIADSCQTIAEFANGQDLSDYEENRMLRRAVERELSIPNRSTISR
jgi:uncharacterized protein with HEPN domain